MILYAPEEKQFNHLGLGILSEVTKAIVTEERNGAFHLDFEYPVNGKLFHEIRTDSIIKCNASHKLKDQRFFVCKISKPMRGRVKVYAKHVSRQAEDNQLKGDVKGNGSATDALNAWISNLVDESHPWTAFSDKNFSSGFSWSLHETDNAMRALGGQKGSLLQVYQGEYEFDNYNIRLWTNRGKRADTIIAYGRNLIDLEQEELIVDTYTSVFPFVYREEDGEETLITIPDIIVHSDHVGKYPSPKILKIDFSDDDSVTDINSLRDAAESYIKRNNVGLPDVSIKLKHQDLSQALGYEDVKREIIGLCDVVPIYFEKLGIETQAKVVATKWNVLLDRYEELTFGDTRKTLAQAVSDKVMPKVEKIRDEAMRYARRAADGKNAVYQGETEPTGELKDGDLWFKKEGTETAMHRFEGGVWVRVIGTDDDIDAGRLTTGTLDAANINVININANNISTGKVRANLVEIGADTEYIKSETEKSTLGTEFSVLDNEIRTKVSQEDFTAVENRVSTAEQKITPEAITSTVTNQVGGKLASENYVQQEIENLNKAAPNLVSNKEGNWEQGTITNGALTVSTTHIRTRAFFSRRAGATSIKVSPLYEAVLVLYDEAYNYLASHGFTNELTLTTQKDGYFKVVLRRKSGGTIEPLAIENSELKVENSEAPTMWTPFFGDLTLDEQKEFYTLILKSDNGWTVDSADFTAKLSAELYLFNKDITLERQGYEFSWYRQYPGEPRVAVGAGPYITVNGADLEKSATYECEFTLSEVIDTLATRNGDDIMTKLGDDIIVIGNESEDALLKITAQKVMVRDLVKELTETKSSIKQMADQIELRVEKTIYDEKMDSVDSQITSLGVKTGVVEAAINGARHTFTSDGYIFKDAQNNEIFSLGKGMASEENLPFADNIASGYPIKIPFHVGETTNSIEQVILKWKNTPFRTYSKGAASGGGATSGASSSTSSGSSSSSTTSSGGSGSVSTYNNDAFTVYTGGAIYEEGNHYHRQSTTIHSHGIWIPVHTHGMSHTHNIAHTHSTPNHSHAPEFGILETSNSSNAIEVFVNGTRRATVNAASGTVDLSAWITTNGWHEIELRSANLKRISGTVYKKTYIRR